MVGRTVGTFFNLTRRACCNGFFLSSQLFCADFLTLNNGIYFCIHLHRTELQKPFPNGLSCCERERETGMGMCREEQV